MKIAIVTDDKKMLSSHIALSKYIAIYDLDDDGKQVEIVPNPLQADPNRRDAGGRQNLGAGRVIPQFLANHGVKALVAADWGEGMKERLLENDITPVIYKEQAIEEILKDINLNIRNNG